MRVGVSLAGVSYTTTGKKRDFRNTYENYHGTLYVPLSLSHSVSTYTTTYHHELTSSFTDAYKPVKSQWLDMQGSHPRSTFVHGLCLVEEEPLDFLICTRFDIKFNQKITDLNVDYTKFNFFFKEKVMWDSHKFVTDTFFAFPIPYLYDMADAIQELCSEDLFHNHTFMHHLYGYVEKRIGTENINFICGEEQAFSHDNRFYKLVRTEI